MNIASVLGEQFFQFLPGVSIVTRRLICLSQTDRHLTLLIRFPALAFQPFEKPVKLVRLQIQFRQFRNDTQPVIQISRFVEGPPIEFDRFAGAELFAESRCEQQQTFRLGRIHADGSSQGSQAFFRFTQLETKLTEEFVQLGISRSGGDQVSTGLNRLVTSTQFLFQRGHLFEVFGPVSSIDRGQLRIDFDGRQQIVLCFIDSGRGHQNRDRLRCQRRGFGDRQSCFFQLSFSFIRPGQPVPAVPIF